MSDKFIQIHSLTSYAGSLLNRDDLGFAKRLPFGGVDRVRISSQCLKRHWRTISGDHALTGLTLGDGSPVPLSVRSRRTFERYVYAPLVEEGVSETLAAALTNQILKAVLPESKKKTASTHEASTSGFRTEQVTVIGRPEVDYFLSLARQAVHETDSPEKAQEWLSSSLKSARKNIEQLACGAGLDAAMFGRMTTGDILSRCDAAVHVAHAFTVHGGLFETDYFSALDDLQDESETGSGHINQAELSTGLYYGYAVVDVPLLVSNIEGCRREDWLKADRTLAAQAVMRLIHLIATVSPGAKLGSTAPYSRALLLLAESGNSQPRSLANAFLKPVQTGPHLQEETLDALAAHLQDMDHMYGRKEARCLAMVGTHSRLSDLADNTADLDGLANWVGGRVGGRP